MPSIGALSVALFALGPASSQREVYLGRESMARLLVAGNYRSGNPTVLRRNPRRECHRRWYEGEAEARRPKTPRFGSAWSSEPCLVAIDAADPDHKRDKARGGLNPQPFDYSRDALPVEATPRDGDGRWGRRGNLLGSARDPLRVGDLFHQGGALAGEAGRVARGPRARHAAVISSSNRRWSRSRKFSSIDSSESRLLAENHHHQFGDRRGQGAVFRAAGARRGLWDARGWWWRRTGRSREWLSPSRSRWRRLAWGARCTSPARPARGVRGRSARRGAAGGVAPSRTARGTFGARRDVRALPRLQTRRRSPFPRRQRASAGPPGRRSRGDDPTPSPWRLEVESVGDCCARKLGLARSFLHGSEDQGSTSANAWSRSTAGDEWSMPSRMRMTWKSVSSAASLA